MAAVSQVTLPEVRKAPGSPASLDATPAVPAGDQGNDSLAPEQPQSGGQRISRGAITEDSTVDSTPAEAEPYEHRHAGPDTLVPVQERPVTATTLISILPSPYLVYGLLDGFADTIAGAANVSGSVTAEPGKYFPTPSSQSQYQNPSQAQGYGASSVPPTMFSSGYSQGLASAPAPGVETEPGPAAPYSYYPPTYEQYGDAYGYGYGYGYNQRGAVEQEDEYSEQPGFWSVAKSWMRTAGEKIVELEAEFWRRVNEAHEP